MAVQCLRPRNLAWSLPLAVLICAVWPVRVAAAIWLDIEKVEASSTAEAADYGLANATDGQVGPGHIWSSACYSDNGDHTEWLAVHLAHSDGRAWVSQITLTPRFDAMFFPRDFCLQYSMDEGSTWKTIPGQEYVNSQITTANPIDFTFPLVEAHDFRIHATLLSGEPGSGLYALQLAEVRLGGYNLLPLGEATASSTAAEPAYAASHVLDGAYGQGHTWASRGYTDNGGHTEWIAVKLAGADAGTNHGVTGVLLTPRPDARCFPKDFRIQYSSDGGTTWNTIAGQEFTSYPAPADNKPIHFGFPCLDASDIRIIATGLAEDELGNHVLELAEVQVEGQDGTCLGCAGATLPLSASAASSEDPVSPASKVMDGDFGAESVWSSSLHEDNERHMEWLAVQLGATASGENHAINRIVLWPRPDGRCVPVDFRIDYSTDLGTTWYTIPSLQFVDFATPQDGAPIAFCFDTVNASNIRVYATKLGGDGDGHWAFQLAEIQVHGQDRMWPFHTSLADSPGLARDGSRYIDADLNNMFSIFAIARNEDPRQQLGSPFVPQTGGVCFWGEPQSVHAYILAYKLAWLRHWWTPEIVHRNIHDIIKYRDSDGFVWTSASDPTYMAQGYHFDNNSKTIIGVSTTCCWDGDVAWLSGNLGAVRAIMDYQMNTLNGAKNLLVIDDPKRPGNNGRFFDPHNRSQGGNASNTWDTWPFGYKSAYGNIYFHESLRSMAEIERLCGNDAQAAAYENAAAATKANFNKTFWDPDKGRYIGCIDVDDASHDYGFTFLNLEALYYGLSDQEKADAIFDWLDGKRTIDGDTSTGSDIYSLVWAPRTNTKAAESIEQNGLYWWYSCTQDNIRCAGPNPEAPWDNFHENGGAIFYASFFDIMARLQYKGADNAYERLKAIMQEFHKDQLRRDPPNNHEPPMYWKYGLVGEYPESGLVPCVYFYGFMGISVDHARMRIRPQLPSGYTYMSVQSVQYRGAVLEIIVTGSTVRIHCTSNPAGRVFDFMGEPVGGLFDMTKPLFEGQATLVPAN